MEGQMSLFDFLPKEPSLIEKTILHGSGKANSKQRILTFFNSEQDRIKRINFLSQEYGIGGWSTDNGWIEYGSSGIDFKYTDEYRATHRSYLSHMGWPMVEKEICRLIEEGRYV